MIPMCALLFAYAFFSNAPAFADSSNYSLYGPDSREDVFEIRDPSERILADSTVALVKNSQLDFHGNGAKLETKEYGKEEQLCAEERFFNEEEAAFCSGAFIGSDLILTAGHCVETQRECDHTSAIFGFAMSSADDKPDHFSLSEIYSCSEIIERRESHGVDFEVLRLNRVVTGHAALQAESESKLARSDELFVIGYPMGLPAKLARGKVVGNPHEHSFEASLDTFAGNSGSPVFNSLTHRIEGILVSGKSDFKKDRARGCYVAEQYDENASSGEIVTQISEALPWFPTPSGEH